LSLDEGVSRFIGRIYESAYDADAWRKVIHELIARTASRLAFVSSVDLRHAQYSRAEFYGTEDSSFARGVEEYVAAMYHDDPSLIWASQHPKDRLCDTSKLMPDEDFRRLPYVTWQESRFATTHWQVFYTEPVDGLTFALSLHRASQDGPPSVEASRLHELLFEHMERALRLAARPPDLADEAEALIIFDTGGQVLAMSPRAEQLVSQCDGLTLSRRRLWASSEDVTARLNSVILSALNTGVLGGAGGGVRIRRVSGRPDWLALVSPCPHYLEHLPVRTPGAVLRLVETDATEALSATHTELFDFSAREAEVAGALLSGHSIESLCAVLGISRNTAKVHLNSIFRKTGTNRQSELVHLLSNVARG
jgi:DNA-binding CsgD family transcriptional regulator